MLYIADIPIVEENHAVIIVLFFATTLAFVVVSMRVFTRLVLVQKLGFDDIAMVVALIGSISFLTGVIYQIRYGLGDAVLLYELESFLEALYLTVAFYSFTQITVKLSITLQYFRIFQVLLARKIVIGFGIWLVVYGLLCVGSSIFTCYPIAKYWDDSIPGGCINRYTLHYVLAGFNIANDFALLIFPMPYLRTLRMPRKAKIVLIGVFACGTFTCIVGIIRLKSLYQFSSSPIEQQPIVGVAIAIWSGLEINVAIICASIPALRALISRAWPGFDTVHSRGSAPNNHHGSLPLNNIRAGDHRRLNEAPHHEDGPLRIKVQQSIAMESLPEDDDSERHLFDISATSWITDANSDDKDGKELGKGGNAQKSRIINEV